MNATGHDVPTMISVGQRGVAERIVDLVPDYMVMGDRGMADMGTMEMPLPDNKAQSPSAAAANSIWPTAMSAVTSGKRAVLGTRPPSVPVMTNS